MTTDTQAPETLTSPFRQAGRDVLLVEAVRTPVGRGHPEKGWLTTVHPVDLLAATYTDLLARTTVPPTDIGDVIIGCTSQIGAQSRNIARNAWLRAGYPVEVPGVTIDRRCGSAQSAVTMGSALIASGTHEVVVAGGVEHMGRVPIDAMLDHGGTVRRPVAPRFAAPFRFRASGRERRTDRRTVGRRATGNGRARCPFSPPGP